MVGAVTNDHTIHTKWQVMKESDDFTNLPDIIYSSMKSFELSHGGNFVTTRELNGLTATGLDIVA